MQSCVVVGIIMARERYLSCVLLLVTVALDGCLAAIAETNIHALRIPRNQVNIIFSIQDEHSICKVWRDRNYYQMSNRQRIPQPSGTRDDQTPCNCASLNADIRSMKLSIEKLQVVNVMF